MHLEPVPRERWSEDAASGRRSGVFLSRRFLVQVFQEENGIIRLSINRTKMRMDGKWETGISWDELQYIKKEIGFGDMYAIEIYPPEKDVINVANMRHLWILPQPLNVGWSNDDQS